MQRLDADVRPVVPVAEAARRRVGEQDVDAGRGAALQAADPAQQPARRARRYSPWLYWFGPGR